MTFNLDSFLQITVPVAAMFVFWVKRLDKKFDKIDQRFEKVYDRFDKVDATLAEQGERISFLEAANIYTMPIEASVPNKRSEIAKEMWKRRKAKKIEQKK